MKLNLENKTVIVTGGATGLGAAICDAFIEEGANAVVFDKVIPTTAKHGERRLLVQGDVTLGSDIEHAIEEAQRVFGRLDILVNNAGIWPSTKVVDLRDEDWERVIHINLGGAFMFSKRFVSSLIDQNKPGCVINIVSPAAYQGSSNGHSHYAASKAGLVSFTRSLALEVVDKGIRVVAVAPGVMQTVMTHSMLEAKGEENYLKRIPIGRFILPSEVANVVVFAASDAASSVTGTTLDATGGMLGH